MYTRWEAAGSYKETMFPQCADRKQARVDMIRAIKSSAHSPNSEL